MAAGENAYKSPEIVIWKIDYDTPKITYKEIQHLRGHRFGIECLKFAPNNKFLISLGDLEEKALLTWDWENN